MILKTKSKEFVLYGLSKYKEVIDEIIGDLNLFNQCFDIKLILTEALTNAFKHGNKGNVDKPIYLRYTYTGLDIKFEIEDSGNGFENVLISNEASEENLLNDGGRGLFLIQSIADKIELKKNILLIQKSLTI